VFGFEDRLALAGDWFSQHLVEGPTTAGWGWTPDVPPNPQNTAEAIEALHTCGGHLAAQDKLVRLIESGQVVLNDSSVWEFATTLDIAWRLRALTRLRTAKAGVTPGFEFVLLRALWDAAGEEGWPFVPGDGGVSIVATAAALHCLGIVGAISEKGKVRRAWETLESAVSDGGDTGCEISAVSYGVLTLSSRSLSLLSTPKSRRIANRGVDWLLERVDGELPVEEEEFRRAGAVDRWRHLSLPLALRAIVTASPHQVLHPNFRYGLDRFCGWQEIHGVNTGGWRTSAEGFVTSYATAGGVYVLASTRAAAEGMITPGATLDLALKAQGRHHADPQKVVTIGRREVILNSYSALAVIALTTPLAVLGAVMSLASGGYKVPDRRAVFVAVFFLWSIAMIAYVVTRLPERSSVAVLGIGLTVVVALSSAMFFII
jgi:hypothetical protein